MRILSFFLVCFCLASHSFAGRYDEVIAGYKGLRIPQLVAILENTGKDTKERIAAFEDIQRKSGFKLLSHSLPQIFKRVETAMKQLEGVTDHDEDRAMILDFFLSNAETVDEARLAKLKEIAFRSEDWGAKSFALKQLSAFAARRNHDIEDLSAEIVKFFKGISDRGERPKFLSEVVIDGEMGAALANTAAEFAEEDSSPESVAFAKILKVQILSGDDPEEKKRIFDELLDFAEHHPKKRLEGIVVVVLQNPLSTDTQKTRAKKLFLARIRYHDDMESAQAFARMIESVPNLSRDEKIEVLDVILAGSHVDSLYLANKRFVLSRIGFGGLSEAERARFADILYSEEALADKRYLQSLWNTPLNVHPDPARFVKAVYAKAKDETDPLQFEASLLILATQFGSDHSYNVPFYYEFTKIPSPGEVVSARPEKQACQVLLDAYRPGLSPFAVKIAMDKTHLRFREAFASVAGAQAMRFEYADTILPWFLEGLKFDTPDAELMPRLEFLASSEASVLFQENYGGMPFRHDCFETGSPHGLGMQNPYSRALVNIWRHLDRSFDPFVFPQDFQPNDEQREQIRQVEEQWNALHPERPAVKAKIKEILVRDPESYRLIGFDVADVKLEQLRAVDMSMPGASFHFSSLFNDQSLSTNRRAERDAIVLEHLRAATDKELRFELAERLFRSVPYMPSGPFSSSGDCVIGGMDAVTTLETIPAEVRAAYLEMLKDNCNTRRQCSIARELWEREFCRAAYKEELVGAFSSLIDSELDEDTLCSVFYCLGKDPTVFAEYADRLVRKLIDGMPQFKFHDSATAFHVRFALINLWNLQPIRENYGKRLVAAFLKMPDEQLEFSAFRELILAFLSITEIRRDYLMDLAELYFKLLMRQNRWGYSAMDRDFTESIVPLMVYPKVRAKYAEKVMREKLKSVKTSTFSLADVFGPDEKERLYTASLDEILEAVQKLSDVNVRNRCFNDLRDITMGMQEHFYKVVRAQFGFLLHLNQSEYSKLVVANLLSIASCPISAEPFAWALSPEQLKKIFKLVNSQALVRRNHSAELEKIKEEIALRSLDPDETVCVASDEEVLLADLEDEANPSRQLFAARVLWGIPTFKNAHRDRLVKALGTILTKTLDLNSLVPLLLRIGDDDELLNEHLELITERVIEALSTTEIDDEFSMTALRLTIEKFWKIDAVREKYGLKLVEAFVQMRMPSVASKELEKVILFFLDDKEMRKTQLVNLAEYYFKVLITACDRDRVKLSSPENIKKINALLIYPAVRARCGELLFRARLKRERCDNVEAIFGEGHEEKVHEAPLDEILAAVNTLTDREGKESCFHELIELTRGVRELLYPVVREHLAFVLSLSRDGTTEALFKVLIEASSLPLSEEPKAWAFSVPQYKEFYDSLKDSNYIQAKFKKELGILKQHVSARILEANAKAAEKKEAK